MAGLPDMLAVVRFAAGGWNFAVEAAQIRAMIPHAGDVGDHGSVGVESLIGLPPAESGRRAILAVGPDARRVEVSEPVELASLPADSLFALPPLVAGRMTLAGVKGMALTPAGPVLIVDLAAIAS